MSTVAPVDLVSMFRTELELCNVHAGETVGIYMEGGQRRNYADAFACAAQELGAGVFIVDVPTKNPRGIHAELGGRAVGSGIQAYPALGRLFRECDLLVDLVLLLWESGKEEIQEAGTRVLSVVEPADVLARLFPTLDQRRRARDAEELLRVARVVRFTNELGTDVTYKLGQYTPFCQYGLADEPGRWDHFAGTLVVTAPNDGGVEGHVVLAPGDLIFPFNRYVTEPVTFTISDGVIGSIEGGVEAFLLRDYMGKYDERAFAVSHIGWGMNENAIWDRLVTDQESIGMDGRSYLGNVMFATGPNTEFGGSNATPSHFDIPMRSCTFYLDGEVLIDRGRIVRESQLVRAEPVPASA